MSQPEISPLARRLAEENNVDWRDLHGSGAGGKVVERDVLEYLARVMAGEEDLDPTPEPVPEGMESWPEADVEAFQTEMRASRKDVGLDEIQRELSAADRQPGSIDLEGAGPGRGIGPSESAPTADAKLPADTAEPLDEAPAGVPEDISEDIFLFDDDDEGEALGAEPPAEGGPADGFAGAEGANWSRNEIDDDLLVAGEESAAWDDRRGAATEGEGGDRIAADGGLPDVFGGEQPATPQEAAGSEALFVDDSATPHGRNEAELEVPPLGDLGLEDDAVPGETFAGGSGWTGPQDWAGESEQEMEPAALGASELDMPETPAADVGGGVWDGDAVPAPQDASTEDAWTEDAWTEDAWTEDAGGAPVEDRVADATVEPWSEEAPAGQAAPTTGGPLGALPLASFGTLLRRHLDVTALAGAQLAVGLELSQGEPLSPAPFLLRAAAKATASEAWGSGDVVMVGWDEEGRLRAASFPEAATAPFTEVLRGLGDRWVDAGGEVAGAALAVADMSALDVDEAILDVDAPLLTLGRILYDNQRGSYRSTLSLAGDVTPERGGRLLARVAELLDAPVRLLL